jgi:hypothetical protein
MLFKIESWIFIFVPISLLILREKKWQQLAILAIGLVSFASVAKLPTYLDLPRYFILALPYLYILSASGCVTIYRGLKQRHTVSAYFFLTLIVLSCFGQFYRLTQINFRQDELDPLAQYVLENEESINGRIWVSNPKVVALTDLKIDELMYYPVFDLQKASQLLQKLPMADYIILDSRALACRPANDAGCERSKERLIKEITDKFDALVRVNMSSESFTIGIFKRRGQSSINMPAPNLR